MDPQTYQQMMIQQLQAGTNGYAPAGTTSALPSTPYGQSMVTGNGMAMAPGGMLGSMPPPSQQLAQPFQAYQGAQ